MKRRQGMTPRSRTTVFAAVKSPHEANPEGEGVSGTPMISVEDDLSGGVESGATGSAQLKEGTESSSSLTKRQSPFDKYKYREDGSGKGDTTTMMKRQRINRSSAVVSSSSSSSASSDHVTVEEKSDQVTMMTPIKKAASPSKASKPASFYPTKAILSSSEAYCAPAPYKYRCRFKGTCDECFHASLQCVHTEEAPLKLLLIGHNPSTHVWDFGYNYGNPTNRMWKLLTGELGDFEGLVPRGSPIELQNQLPSELQIGLTDVALVPGNDANELSDKVMQCWRPNLYARLTAHVERVNQVSYRGPSICAFTGKRQFTTLFEKPPKNVPFGRLAPDVPLPPNWPFPHCQIWVLPSSSGRAAMTHEQRFTPYKQLAEELRRLRNDE